MLQVEMSASERKVTGKGAMRQLRIKGMTPAVVYGAGSEALSIQLETQPLFQQLLKITRKNAVVTLNVDGGSTKHVFLKDVQTDPIKDTLLHVDFFEIDINETRRFEIPIKYKGVAKGCDLGGILHIAKESITVEGTPLEMPDELVVNLTPLKIGDSIKVKEIEIPGNLKVLLKPGAVCVSVTAGKKEIEGDD